MSMVKLGSLDWLQPQLDAIFASSSQTVSRKQRGTLDSAAQWLTVGGAVAQAMRAGDTAADFALLNQHGRTMRLYELLAKGSLALVFFRGPWCPYCSATLMAWERQGLALRDVGCRVIAISPQTPEASAETARLHNLSFSLLSDLGCEIASAFRVSYRIPTGMRALYQDFGVPLAERNAGDSHHLPLPSTFLLDQDGVVRLADVHGDPARRLDPIEAVDVLRTLGHRPTSI